MSYVETLESRAMFADVMGAATAVQLPAVQLPAVQLPAVQKTSTPAITDGTSNTIMTAEAHPGGVNVLFGDGSVRFVKDTVTF